MEKDTEKTEVIFRKWPDGQIIALFPYVIECRDGKIMSYMHFGQHGAADYFGVCEQTKLATPEEYEHLQIELEREIGYSLAIIKRSRKQKYGEARNKQHYSTLNEGRK